ncbi:hypothetical protein GWO13_05765 [Candidatus Bathyarchaeota archaeon]|nr:hypothetical protein [Candidatus Bathyarchaeota archaeon]
MSNESGVTICSNPRCQRKIEEPILLNCLSTKPAERYYACPHCFIKLDVDTEKSQPKKEEEKKEEKPAVEPLEKEKEPAAKPLKKEGKGPSGCPHHFGYLAKRPKDAPIPQECLVCSRIVDCMLNPGGA